MIELAADARSDLGNGLHRRRTIQARDERVPERRRDRCFPADRRGLEHRLRHFLDKERNAIRMGKDLAANLIRQCPSGNDAGVERDCLGPCQATKR